MDLIALIKHIRKVLDKDYRLDLNSARNVCQLLEEQYWQTIKEETGSETFKNDRDVKNDKPKKKKEPTNDIMEGTPTAEMEDDIEDIIDN